MSDGSSDLAARALAAAAAERAEQEEQARRERARQAQAYYQARRAAAATASEVLGYPVPPKRWEVEWYTNLAAVRKDWRVKTVVEGVGLFTQGWPPGYGPDPARPLPVFVIPGDVQGFRQPRLERLTLASFGRALEELEASREIQRAIEAGDMQRVTELAEARKRQHGR